MATNFTNESGKDYYRIKRKIGEKIVDGEVKSIYKYFYGRSEQDAKKKYNAYVREQARKEVMQQYELDTTTFHERAKDYIENALTVSAKYAAGTKKRYKSAYEIHIKGSFLDKMAVKDIRASDIQAFYNSLDVSMSTLKNVNRFMSAFYKWLARNEYGSDVLSAVELPVKPDTTKHEEIVIWSDDDWKTLTSQNFDFSHDLLIKLMSYSGMRIGECLGLKYSDVWDDTIHVTRQYTDGEIKEPKYGSKREIPMHDKIKAAYEEHKRQHEHQMRTRGYRTEYIFTTSTGNLYDLKNLYRSFERLYRRIGVDRHGFHTYRSTFCTKLCEAGVPIEVASKLLGHKSIEVTAAHYALVRSSSKQDAIALLK